MSERPLFVRLLDTVKSTVDAESLYFEALQKVQNKLPAELRAGLETETAFAVKLRDVAFPEDADSLTSSGEALASAVVQALRELRFSTDYPARPASFDFPSQYKHVDGLDDYLVWLLMTANGKATGFRWIGALSATAASAATGPSVFEAPMATPPSARTKELSLGGMAEEKKQSAKELRLLARDKESVAALAKLPATRPYAKPEDEPLVQLMLDAAEVELHATAVKAYEINREVYKAVEAIRQDPAALKILEQASAAASMDDVRPYAKPEDEPLVQLLLDAAEVQLYQQEMEVFEETATLIEAWNLAIKDAEFVRLLRQVQSERGITFEENQEQVKRKILGILDAAEKTTIDDVEDRVVRSLERLDEDELEQSPAFRAQQNAVLDTIIDKLGLAPKTATRSVRATGLLSVAAAAAGQFGLRAPSTWAAVRSDLFVRIRPSFKQPDAQALFIAKFAEHTFPGCKAAFNDQFNVLTVSHADATRVEQAIRSHELEILGEGNKLMKFVVRRG